MNGQRPDRPEKGQELGLKDSVWDMTVRCWDQDPAQRPTMAEVTGFLHEFLVSSLSIESSLSDFFRVCKTLDKDDQGEKAQEFADSLDKVCHDERHDISRPIYHPSRFLTMQIFKNENASDI